MKIQDKVKARTNLMKCRLVGTITDIKGDTYYIRLLIPIKGISEVQCQREHLQRIEEKKSTPTQNKSMKTASNKIIAHLQTIANEHDERAHTAHQNQQKKRDISHSNNWLDYMERNDIE